MELKLINNLLTGGTDYLLIVPYGIETPYIYIWVNRTQPFNRTLWN